VGRDNSVRIFDSTNWETEIKLNGFATTVVSCFFSANGRLLFTRTFGGELWIWNMLSQEVIAELEVPSSWLPAMALDTGGMFLAVGDSEGVIHDICRHMVASKQEEAAGLMDYLLPQEDPVTHKLHSPGKSA
jgi:hypothetical protein